MCTACNLGDATKQFTKLSAPRSLSYFRYPVSKQSIQTVATVHLWHAHIVLTNITHQTCDDVQLVKSAAPGSAPTSPGPVDGACLRAGAGSRAGRRGRCQTGAHPGLCCGPCCACSQQHSCNARCRLIGRQVCLRSAGLAVTHDALAKCIRRRFDYNGIASRANGESPPPACDSCY